MQVAQVNVGRLLAPLDSPRLAGFVAALEPINALADAAPGFVWRLQTDQGDATGVRPTNDDLLLINLSTWASVELLAAFTYRSDHAEVMRGRRQWFEHLRDHITALWWVPDGHRPTTYEAMARLGHLRRHGPTPRAFTFAVPFGPADAGDRAASAPVTDDWLCPA